MVSDGTDWVSEAPTTARSSLGLGSAATKNAGTGADSVLLLSEANKLPILDGSSLTDAVTDWDNFYFSYQKSAEITQALNGNTWHPLQDLSAESGQTWLDGVAENLTTIYQCGSLWHSFDNNRGLYFWGGNTAGYYIKIEWTVYVYSNTTGVEFRSRVRAGGWQLANDVSLQSSSILYESRGQNAHTGTHPYRFSTIVQVPSGQGIRIDFYTSATAATLKGWEAMLTEP